jgi:hypothetical protein
MSYPGPVFNQPKLQPTQTGNAAGMFFLNMKSSLKLTTPLDVILWCAPPYHQWALGAFPRRVCNKCMLLSLFEIARIHTKIWEYLL